MTITICINFCAPTPNHTHIRYEIWLQWAQWLQRRSCLKTKTMEDSTCYMSVLAQAQLINTKGPGDRIHTSLCYFDPKKAAILFNFWNYGKFLVSKNSHYNYKRYQMDQSTTKQTKWPERPVKTQISLGFWVWSETSLSAWRIIGSLASYWAYSEDSTDQTMGIYRLIRDSAGHKGHFVGFDVLQLI